MSVAVVARPSSLREIPRAAWALLALGSLMLLYLAIRPGGLALGSIAFVAPVFFAAAVTFAAPADRRLVWSAILLAAPPVIVVIGGWLPQWWFDTVPGDWKNATPVLMDLASATIQLGSILQLAGLVLLGLALGGVRTLLSTAILGVAVVLAILNVMRFLGQPIEDMPTLDVARTIVLTTGSIVGWAFVFAAALESRRALMSIGFGLIVAVIALDYVALYQPGPSDLLLVGTAVLSLLPWVLVIAGVLRGELNAAPSRKAGDL